MRAVRCARPPAPASTPAGSARAIADAALVVSLARLARVAGDGFAVNRLARHAVQTRPRLCRRRCRRARQPMPHRPPPRLRHRICLGASHRRRTLASRKRDRPRFSSRRPGRGRASRRHRRALLRCEHQQHARARDDDDHGDRALTSAMAHAVRQFTSPPPMNCAPMCTLGVSAVADGDERRDALPGIGVAAPERPGVNAPDTRDEHGDRPAAPIAIASLRTSSRLPFGQPSPARRGRTTACRRQALPPRLGGWALTPLLASLKSRLYGGAA